MTTLVDAKTLKKILAGKLDQKKRSIKMEHNLVQRLLFELV